MNDGDMILNSFMSVLDAIQANGLLPLITIYWNPSDYPDQAVGRVSVVGANLSASTKYIVLRDTIDELRHLIPDNMVHIPRSPDDDPCIVEVWI